MKRNVRFCWPNCHLIFTKTRAINIGKKPNNTLSAWCVLDYNIQVMQVVFQFLITLFLFQLDFQRPHRGENCPRFIEYWILVLNDDLFIIKVLLIPSFQLYSMQLCLRPVSVSHRLTNTCEERYCLMSEQCLDGSEYSFALYRNSNYYYQFLTSVSKISSKWDRRKKILSTLIYMPLVDIL